MAAMVVIWTYIMLYVGGQNKNINMCADTIDFPGSLISEACFKGKIIYCSKFPWKEQNFLETESFPNICC